jgi:hypothetical protein
MNHQFINRSSVQVDESIQGSMASRGKGIRSRLPPRRAEPRRGPCHLQGILLGPSLVAVVGVVVFKVVFEVVVGLAVFG